mmetsp:Transcript_25568/g.59052  ORF Transcript_25568/g.59052 Transcript_25568/m.59052 type:complete len:247 (-) Transcript_25568:76-816(-)
MVFLGVLVLLAAGATLCEAIGAAEPHTLKLRPRDFAKYIATGRVPNAVAEKLHSQDTASLLEQDIGKVGLDVSASEPNYEAETQKIVDSLQAYEQKLMQVTTMINVAAEEVDKHELELNSDYAKAIVPLKDAVAVASNQAARAEVQSMLERLARIYFKQVAWLDRSSRYLEDQKSCEGDLALLAQAQKRTVAQATELQGLQAAYQAKALEQVSPEEVARIDEWSKGFDAQVKQHAAVLQMAPPPRP